MNAPLSKPLDTTEALNEAITTACGSIAPTWPLDRMIAVNPYWGRIHKPFEEAAATLEKVAGSPLTLPLSYYRERWNAGEIQYRHLEKAIEEGAAEISVQHLVDALKTETRSPAPPPLLCDTLDRQRDLLHEPAWCDAVTHQIAQFCAAYFDGEQADWHPNDDRGLYASWRRTLTRDHSVALLMKAPKIPALAKTLAEDPDRQIEQALEQLGLDADQWPLYLQAVLMRISGWAAWCAYRRWQARLEGGDDRTLSELLAIRLSWECLLDDGNRRQGSVWQRWQSAWRQHFQQADDKTLRVHCLWQRAQEIAYQEKLCRKLVKAPQAPTASAAKVQAAFCIDVRSEVFRRHLEAQSDHIQTIGFAGFFGLPISYTPVGTQAIRPQLPGLLAPAMNVSDTSGDANVDRKAIESRQTALKNRAGWRAFQSVPASAFTLVETLGLGYAAKLIKRSLPASGSSPNPDSLALPKSYAQALRPELSTEAAGGVAGQAKLAAQALTGMNLTEGLAPLVLLIGHGSQNQNNPQRAGLDCGACCGQSGDVNARALARLLNDRAVRDQLPKHGIVIPDGTHFVAGLHNTTTDEVQLFDTDLAPDTHTEAMAEITEQLAGAGREARRERAPGLGLQHLTDKPAKLADAVKRRANDWAQTRPEWGLANNAAFIVAPRSRTRTINLEGRSFLHEYDYRNDPEGILLEQIMTAPMIVTHWINMQYHASTVDNHRYGSGNKTLHNVVGGRLGVFEGNGGDLRTGLAWQSVHDGESWRHAPLRLTVVLEAPQKAIDRVIAKHDMVRQLADNRWLYLAKIENETISFYRDGQWQDWQSQH